MTDARTEDLVKICTALYIAYAACALSVFAPFVTVVVVASLAMLVAIIYAYVAHDKAAGTIYESHLRWLIRTFWIGGGVYLPILTVFMVIAVWTTIDFTELENAIKVAAVENTPGARDDNSVLVDTIMKNIQEKNGATIMFIITLFVLPVVGWWLWRCWTGFKLMKEGKPVENVTRWF